MPTVVLCSKSAEKILKPEIRGIHQRDTVNQCIRENTELVKRPLGLPFSLTTSRSTTPFYLATGWPSLSRDRVATTLGTEYPAAVSCSKQKSTRAMNVLLGSERKGNQRNQQCSTQCVQ